MWNPGWDKLFEKRPWGSYPPEELVRFMARSFFHHADRGGVKVLELGCGPGANLWFLAREGFSAYGLDGSAVALQQAAHRLKAERLKVQLDRGDATALPHADSVFDCVLDIECAYANTLSDSRRIIKEAHRVLKPGGIFFSMTFMTGTSGDGKGTRLKGEPHTYLDIQDEAFNSGYGVIRLTAEEEICQLYGTFHSIEYDYVVRSDKNRRHETKQWLITCRKQTSC